MSPDSTRTPTGTLQWPLPVVGTITSQFGHRITHWEMSIFHDAFLGIYTLIHHRLYW